MGKRSIASAQEPGGFSVTGCGKAIAADLTALQEQDDTIPAGLDFKDRAPEGWVPDKEKAN